MEQYIYPTSIDPFQYSASTESLKESQLASPSSTSSSSCSNYSMMMVPPTAVPAAAGSGQIAFYAPQTAAEVRTTTAWEILVTPRPPTLRLKIPPPTPYPIYPCIMFCSIPPYLLYCFLPVYHYTATDHFYYPVILNLYPLSYQKRFSSFFKACPTNTNATTCCHRPKLQLCTILTKFLEK